MTNCPNCGAPISNYKCEYCGTLFDVPDTAKIYANNQLYIELEIDKARADLVKAQINAAIAEQNQIIMSGMIKTYKSFMSF